jgi:Domain of unknown function (DUF4296)
MIRFTFLILIMFSIITGSCSGRKKKLEKSNLIPEKELVSILTDIHLADGLLALPKINTWFSSLDSISTYIQIIEKHGYTKQIMDNTMKYYFIKNPKRLTKIYDQVLGILSEMESRVEKESILEIARVSNLWPGKEYYSFPNIQGTDSTMFDVTLDKPGFYTLSYSVTLFPDDQSINPRATVYSCSPDSIETGKKRYIETIIYLKDGRPHSYNLIVSVPEKKILHLRGWLYDFDNRPFGLEKHVKFENISLTYSLAAL